MDANLVSVIIPVYNVAPYLDECIASVTGQSYKKLQIILVDDGSTDNSGKICDEYAAVDERITVIHQENSGLSAARNTGTMVAVGEFLLYLDSDDYLLPDSVSKLVDAQQRNCADVVIGNYRYDYADHTEPAVTVFPTETIFNTREAINELVCGRLQTFAWGKLIRSNIAHGQQFPAGKLFEDHFWTHLVFNCSERIVYIPFVAVAYRQRKDSISFSYTLNRLDVLEAWRERAAFLNAQYPGLLIPFYEACARNITAIAWLVLTRMRKNKSIAFRRIKAICKDFELQKYADSDSVRLIRALECNSFCYCVVAVWKRITGIKT